MHFNIIQSVQKIWMLYRNYSSTPVTCTFSMLYICITKSSQKISYKEKETEKHPLWKGDTGDHQCGFWHNKSTADHIFCVRQLLKKQWKYNEGVHQLFIDFKTDYDSVRREVLYNIFIEFSIHLKLARLIKMCLNKSYSRVRVGKHLSGRFPIRNGVKHGDALSLLLFKFALVCR